MADARTFLVRGPTGALLADTAAAGMAVFAYTRAGASVSAPAVAALGVGTGQFQVLPSDSDEATGTVLLIDTGVGNEPRRVVFAVHKADNSNQFWAFCVEDATTGALWAGAAPTIGSYRSSAGVSLTPPAFDVVASPYLYALTPSASDVTADVSARIDGPAGSAQDYWTADAQPVVPTSIIVTPPVVVTPPTPPYVPPAGGSTLLLDNSSVVPVLTTNQETDALGALIRGLAEYLQTLSWDAVGGRNLRFKAVRREWAEPEQQAKYPSAVVFSRSEAVYDASGFTPSVNPAQQLPAPDGRFVISPSAMVVDLDIEVWGTDPQERIQLSAMLERALQPVAYRSGFQLTLPHYFGSIGTYLLKSVLIDDDQNDAIRRYRRANFTVNATVPVVQLVGLPTAKPRFDLRNVGTDIIVLEIVVT